LGSMTANEDLLADSRGPDNGTQVSASPGRLRRSVRFRHLIGNGLVFIGPAAPVSIYGVLDARSDGAVAAVYVVATIIMGLTAVSYAQMSGAVPKAGSVFSYATAGIGPSTGFMAGWMVLLDYMLIPSVAFLFTGLAMHSFLPSVPAWIFTGVAIVVATTLNLTGVKNLARAAIVVVVIEALTLGAVLVGALVVITTTGAARPVLSPLTGVGGFSTTAVIGAVSVATLAYLGFDAIATFAEETTGASKLVGRAMLACLALVGVLFVAQSYVIQLLTPISPGELAAHPELQGSLYYDVVRQQVDPWLSTALGMAKALGACFSGMVGLAAGGRVVMTMARERRLPRAMSSVTARTGIPTKAIAAITVVTLVLAVWAARIPTGLDLLSSAVSIGALSAFLLLHASVVGYFIVRRRSRRYLVHLIVPILAVASLIPVLALADRAAQLVGGTWLIVGLIIVAIQRKKRTTSSGAAVTTREMPD
ncbi:MAG: APC family permease, partial [Sciscionella sp.]